MNELFYCSWSFINVYVLCNVSSCCDFIFECFSINVEATCDGLVTWICSRMDVEFTTVVAIIVNRNVGLILDMFYSLLVCILLDETIVSLRISQWGTYSYYFLEDSCQRFIFVCSLQQAMFSAASCCSVIIMTIFFSMFFIFVRM